MESIVLSKRASGGYKIVVDGTSESHFSNCSYTAYKEGIVLFGIEGNPINSIPVTPDKWTVQEVTGFTTNEQVSNALDAILISPIEVLPVEISEPIEVVTPDTGYTGKVINSIVELTRPADTTDEYAVNDSVNSSTSAPAALTLASVVSQNGGGAILQSVKLETDMVILANKTLRIWLYNSTPSVIPNDNEVFNHAYADAEKRLFYVDVTFSSQMGTSDTIVGISEPLSFLKAADTTKDIKLLIFTQSVFTPTSGGKIKITGTFLQL